MELFVKSAASFLVTAAGEIFSLPASFLSKKTGPYPAKKRKKGPPDVTKMDAAKAQSYLGTYDSDDGTIQMGNVRLRVTPEYVELLKAKATELSLDAGYADVGTPSRPELWDMTEEEYAVPSTPVPSTPAKKTRMTGVTGQELAQMLMHPQKARDAIESYQKKDPAFAKELKDHLLALKMDPKQLEAPQAAPNFQSPTWANPQMQQQMQQMYEQSQRNKQFDEWATQAKSNYGFTDEQIQQLRRSMMPQQQMPMSPWLTPGGGAGGGYGGYGGYPAYYGAPSHSQPEQPKRTFWGDVARGAAGGAAGGAALGGAFGLGGGAVPGAAIGGLAGGAGGAVSNLYKRGKDYWNKFKEFNRSRQQNPYARSASTQSPIVTAYLKVSKALVKCSGNELDTLHGFMETLNDQEVAEFGYLVDMYGPPELYEESVLTAAMGSSQSFVVA